MSTMYGGGGYAPGGPPRQVSFGWIGEAWGLFGQSAGLWILASFAYAVLPIIAYALSVSALMAGMVGLQRSGHYNPYGPGASFALLSTLPAAYIVLLVGFVLIYVPFMYACLFRMAVKQVRGEQVVAGDIFAGGRAMLPMVALYVLIALVSYVVQFVFSLGLGATHFGAVTPGANGQPVPSFGGPSLLILLGSLLVSLLIYTVTLPAYALVADGEGPVSSLRRSVTSMVADLGNGLLFMFAFGLLLTISMIPCGLGLLVTLPMLYLISALAYRDMVGMPGAGTSGGVPQGGYGAPQPGVWPPPPASGQAPPPNWGGPPA